MTKYLILWYYKRSFGMLYLKNHARYEKVLRTKNEGLFIRNKICKKVFCTINRFGCTTLKKKLPHSTIKLAWLFQCFYLENQARYDKSPYEQNWRTFNGLRNTFYEIFWHINHFGSTSKYLHLRYYNRVLVFEKLQLKNQARYENSLYDQKWNFL